MTENQFTQAIKKTHISGATQPDPPRLERGSKHIGGYFHPGVARKLKQIALDEDTTVQALVGEALSWLLQSREETINEEV